MLVASVSCVVERERIEFRGSRVKRGRSLSKAEDGIGGMQDFIMKEYHLAGHWLRSKSPAGLRGKKRRFMLYLVIFG